MNPIRPEERYPKFKRPRMMAHFLQSRCGRYPNQWSDPNAHIPFVHKCFNHEARTPQQERDLRNDCRHSADPNDRALYPRWPGFGRAA